MTFDTHPDLIVQPYSNGVKLVEPNQKRAVQFPSIETLFAMPLMVYFVRFDVTYVDANHFTYLTNIPGNQGYYSDNDLKGTPFSNIFRNETVDILNNENINILNTRRLTIYESTGFRLDDLSFSSLSFKFPLFNSDNKIIGVFGISALTDQSTFTQAENLSSAIDRIINTGLIPHTKNITPGSEINGVYFSNQEIKCIRLIVAGKTIKSIAQQLKLSARTVEYYFSNIKRKLNVKSKSEFIEKVIEHIWPEILL